uniref:Uncharacterized protein n=1 Tax=Arundo donax TaxID=35708 RepID=A0A0A8YRU7_ARUDO
MDIGITYSRANKKGIWAPHSASSGLLIHKYLQR